MSSTLVYRPIGGGKSLPDGIKIALRKKNGGQTVHNMVLDDGNIEYLRGLEDAGVEGASELIEAIQSLRQLEVDEEF
jgi:hypothetical protein